MRTYVLYKEGQTMNIKNYTKTNILNKGLINLGFETDEAIREYIDNEFDAGGNNIRIKIFKNNYKVFSIDENEKSKEAQRFAFAIIGNGNSFEYKELEKVFSIGDVDEIKQIFNKTINGKFHYGIISGLGIGYSLKIFTKKEHEDFYTGKEIHYNELSDNTYESNIFEVNNEQIKSELGSLYDSDFIKGTIIIVEGITEKKLWKKIDGKERFLESCKNNIGITYYEQLKHGNKIELQYENDKKIEIKPIDPIGVDLPDDIKSHCIANYTISLRELLERIDDIEKEKIKYLINNKAVKSEEKISIRFYKLGTEKYSRKEAKFRKDWPEISEYCLPSTKYTGIYVKRNNRYIGSVIDVGDIFGRVNHQSFTRFRGVIEFNSLFDDYLGIQINKNRSNVSEVIKEIIDERIMNDSNLKGDTPFSRITSAIESNNDENEKMLLNDYEYKQLSEKLNKLRANLDRYNQDTKCLDKIEDMIIKKGNIAEIKIRLSEKEADYINNKKCKYKYIDNLIKRVVNDNNTKRLTNTNDEFKMFEGIKEAEIEIDVYKWFSYIWLLKPELFEFDPIKYHTQEGVDYVVKLKKDIYDELNMEERFGELKDIISTKLKLKEPRYAFVEFKHILNKNMNHSLAFVSHIVCWRKKKNINEIEAEDGIYELSGYKENKWSEILVGPDNKLIKILYLREFIKEKTNGKWEN